MNNEPRRGEFLPTPPILTPPVTSTPGLVARGVLLAVIQSVDNANFPQFATVLINNKLPGESGYALPAGCGPFAAGGTTGGFQYFYNNSSGVGGSFCYVDADAHVVINFTGNVSTTPPTPYYKALADHQHNGNLSPDSFQNPAPVNLSNGEISSQIPYGNQTPAVQTVVGSDGALLATMFPGQAKQITSGQYAGMFQLLTATVQDPKPINISQATTASGSSPWVSVTWQFLTTYSNGGKNYSTSSSNVYGPSIWDSNGNRFGVDFYNFDYGANLYSNGFSATDPWINQLHTVQFMLKPLNAAGAYSPMYIFLDGQPVAGNTPTTLGPQQLTGPFYAGWYTNNTTLYPPTGVYARIFRFEQTIPEVMMPVSYMQNWSYAGGSSTTLATTQAVSGSTMNLTPYVTDFTLHYSVNSGATLLTYWYDNGSGADSKAYNTYDNTGATDVNIGHTTSGTPSGTFAVSSGQTVYIIAYWTFGNNRMNWVVQTTPFTGTQIRAAYLDGSLAAMASLTTSTSNPSGPVSITANATGTRTGNGGRTQQ